MSTSFDLDAQIRHDKGKGASRRLRRAGKVPAILYGGGSAPLALVLDHDPVMHNLENEAFYSHILNVRLEGAVEKAVLKDLQRHAHKPVVLHMDLQRVSETEKIRMHVPVHFLGEDQAPGVKQAGGVISHLLNDAEVVCLPRDLPEYLEVDLSGLQLNETLHLSDIRLPAGVELVELLHGPEHDRPVVSIHKPRAAAAEEAEAAAPAAAVAPAEAKPAAEGEKKEG